MRLSEIEDSIRGLQQRLARLDGPASPRADSPRAPLRVETLRFRCDRLRAELLARSGDAAQLRDDLQNRCAHLRGLQTRQRDVDAELKRLRATLLPAHQRLKSQLAVAELELRALAHDGALLRQRVGEARAMNARLRAEGVAAGEAGARAEAERLASVREMEAVRGEVRRARTEEEETRERAATARFETERIRAELLIARRKAALIANETLAESIVPNASSLHTPARIHQISSITH